MKESSVASVNQQMGSLLSLLASHWEVAAYALLILVAASMRFWDLGARAIGYDESLHLYYSFRLAEGLGYQHNPLSHGPFQYHGIAAMFFLFGDSEFTSRLPAAIFGTVLVALPYFFRSHLGRAGALVTAVLLAFSPMMLFYSRYARNDIFMAVWTLGLIILLWRYMVEGKPRYLYLSALALAMAFATKETTFFVVGILGSYLLIVAAKDWVPWLLRRPAAAGVGADQPDDEYRYTPGIGYGYGRANRPARLSAFSRPGVFLVLLSTLLLPQAAALVSLFQNVLKSYGVVLAGSGGPVGAPAGDVLWTIQDVDITKGMVIAALVVFAALWFSTLVGVSWNRQVWLRCAAVFYSVWLLLYTTFFTNALGVASGMWQSLGYWIVQHDVNRGDQPWYYYFVIAPLYETLPLIFSVAGVVYYTLRGNSFTRFLSYWVVTTVLLYTWAGEKMPWLLASIALPMIVLSGKLIGDMIAAVRWRRVLSAGGLYLIPLTSLLLYLLVRLILFDIERGRFFNFVEFWALFVVVLVLVGLGVHLVLRSGAGNGLRIVALSFALVLLVLAVRTGWHASYINGDIPEEMLVYAQDSREVPGIMADIRELAQSTGEGDQLRVTVDKDIYWGLVWYVRDYETVDYFDAGSATQEPEGSVLLISDRNKDRMARYVGNYGPGREFMYLWWPPEGYKPCSDRRDEPCLGLGEAASSIFSRDKWRGFLDYYIYRKTDIDYLNHRAIAYFVEEPSEP